MKFWIPNNEIIYKFPESTHLPLAIIGGGFLYLAYWCLKYLDHYVMNNKGVCKTGPFKEVMGLYFRVKILTSLNYNNHSFSKYLRHPLYLALGSFYFTAPEISKGSVMFISFQLIYVMIAVFTLEEPRMVKIFGQEYKDYQKGTFAMCPLKAYKDEKKKE